VTEKQSRFMSFVEAMTNVAIGYSVALLSQLIVFPLVGIHISLSTNILIGAIFTVISIVRSYIVRRGFEWLRVNRSFNFGRTQI